MDNRIQLEPAFIAAISDLATKRFSLTEVEEESFRHSIPYVLRHVCKQFSSLDPREVGQQLIVLLLADGDRLRRSWKREKGPLAAYLQKILLREAVQMACLVQAPAARPSRDTDPVLQAKRAALSEYRELDEEIADPNLDPLAFLIAIEEGDSLRSMSSALRDSVPWLVGRIGGLRPRECGCLAGARERIRHVLEGLESFSRITGVDVPAQFINEAVRSISGWRNREGRTKRGPITTDCG